MVLYTTIIFKNLFRLLSSKPKGDVRIILMYLPTFSEKKMGRGC